MAKANNIFKMEVRTKEISQKARRMDRESSNGAMAKYTKAVSKMESLMEEANCISLSSRDSLSPYLKETS